MERKSTVMILKFCTATAVTILVVVVWVWTTEERVETSPDRSGSGKVASPSFEDWPLTRIREQQWDVTWDEQQLFQFHGTIDGGRLRDAGDSDGYYGPTTIEPLRPGARLKAIGQKPVVMMLKRVTFVDNVAGRWHRLATGDVDAPFEEERPRDVVLHKSGEFEETRVLHDGDDLFGPENEWLVAELQGRWTIDPHKRTITVTVEKAPVLEQMDLSVWESEQLRRMVLGEEIWRIEEVKRDQLCMVTDRGLTFDLVRQDSSSSQRNSGGAL